MGNKRMDRWLSHFGVQEFLKVDFIRMGKKYNITKEYYEAWCKEYLKDPDSWPREWNQVRKELLDREEIFRKNNPKEIE